MENLPQFLHNTRFVTVSLQIDPETKKPVVVKKYLTLAQKTDTNIISEYEMQKKASELGVAPKVISLDISNRTIIMEYVPGITLGAYIFNIGIDTNDFRQTEVYKKIRDALKILHDGGIVHNDLTGGNIILSFEDTDTNLRIVKNVTIIDYERSYLSNDIKDIDNDIELF